MFLCEFDLESSGIKYNKTLPPAIWQGKKMRAEVRQALLRIAAKFIESLDYPQFDTFDIRIVGSAVNYNYSKFSDIDLHIVTDLREYDSEELAQKFFHAKKSLWNERHEIMIGSYEVEVYIEPLADPPETGGLFSLKENEWMKTPSYSPPDIDDSSVIAKSQELMDLIDRVLSDEPTDADDLSRMREKIWKMRKGAVAAGGEWATENLAFKVLRNKGYLDKLLDAEASQQDQELSIR